MYKYRGKLAHIGDALFEDMQAVVPLFIVKGLTKISMAIAYSMLYEVSAQRAYDDTHPRWTQIKRVLPYDGRYYCWYYEEGANDTHVNTLLRQMLPMLQATLDKQLKEIK